MRTYAEAYEAARDEWPFSNGTEGYAWMGAWCCSPCTQDKNEDCPLIAVALMGRTPSEWIEQPWGERGPSLYDRYHCIEFRAEGDEDPEPKPIPDPPDQGLLWPRGMFEGTRMLAQPSSADDLRPVAP